MINATCVTCNCCGIVICSADTFFAPETIRTFRTKKGSYSHYCSEKCEQIHHHGDEERVKFYWPGQSHLYGQYGQDHAGQTVEPMKRIIRDRYLTDEEAAKYDLIRKQVEADLPDLIERHHQRMDVQQKFEHLHRRVSIQRKFTEEMFKYGSPIAIFIFILWIIYLIWG